MIAGMPPSTHVNGCKGKHRKSLKKVVRHPLFALGLVATVALLTCCAGIMPFLSPTALLPFLSSKAPNGDTQERIFTAQDTDSVEEFDTLNAKLLGPDAYGGPGCPKECGCSGSRKDCPRWYTSEGVQKSAAVNNPRVMQEIKRRMADLTVKAVDQCEGRGFVGSGGWCLSAQNPPVYFVAGKHKLDIAVNHVAPSERVVMELSKMIAKEGIKSINDFGAGVGQYKAAVLDKYPNLEYRAYDGSGNIEQFTKGFLTHFDLTIPFDLPKTDWVMSLEVGEHVPSKYEGMLIRNLHRHNCKGIILSWAVFGQSGYRHINNHGVEYIQDVFEKLGYTYDTTTTKGFRNPSKNYHWFRGSIFVFRRKVAVC